MDNECVGCCSSNFLNSADIWFRSWKLPSSWHSRAWNWNKRTELNAWIIVFVALPKVALLLFTYILTIKYITSFSLLYAPIALKSRLADSKCFFACSTSTRPSLENLPWLVVRLVSGETVSEKNGINQCKIG